MAKWKLIISLLRSVINFHLLVFFQVRLEDWHYWFHRQWKGWAPYASRNTCRTSRYQVVDMWWMWLQNHWQNQRFWVDVHQMTPDPEHCSKKLNILNDFYKDVSIDWQNRKIYLFIKNHKKNEQKYKLYCKQYRSFQLNKNDSSEK